MLVRMAMDTDGIGCFLKEHELTDCMNGPDYGSVQVTMVDYPWSGVKHAHAEFNDPLLHGYEATMVMDTVPVGTGASDVPDGGRLCTMVLRFPRVILPEVNTHRVFSRNSASSRARAVRSTIGAVMNDPYIPLWTVNQRGMSGKFADGDTSYRATMAWLDARDNAVLSELRLLLGDLLPVDATVDKWSEYVDLYNDVVYHADNTPSQALNIHKQNANRLIEPFSWHEALVTSSMWTNFLNLRLSESAQPEIRAVAVLVDALLRNSKPEERWVHIPFTDDVPADDADWDDMLPMLMRSASECARISYKDRSNMENRDDTALGERLLKDRHMSPFEHIAFDNGATAQHQGVQARIDTVTGELGDGILNDNLGDQWVQLRHLVERPW